MKTYEKPMVEVIDFTAECIMNGEAGGKFSGIEEGNEPL